MTTVLSVVGTRPEAIKMAPVLDALAEHADHVRSVVCSTGQHREMLQPVFELFGIIPDHDLQLMRPDQTLAGLTAALVERLDRVVAEVRPDWLLAQGDTTSVLAAALVAFYRGVPFGHVEAGLRTGDRARPFPEEINRRIADLVASAYFVPTERARQTLRTEGCDERRIVLTGNTIVDAVQRVASRPFDWSSGPLAALPHDRQLVLVTAHRRESFGAPLQQVALAIRDLAAAFEPEGVHFVYPMHLNPNVRQAVAAAALQDAPGVSLIEPLDYLALVHLMKRSILILTDSGGIQEEAPELGVPVLVLRDATERPEGLEAGVARLVGTDRARIVAETARLLHDPDARQAMIARSNPYGDGQAARRIVDFLLAHRPGPQTPETSRR